MSSSVLRHCARRVPFISQKRLLSSTAPRQFPTSPTPQSKAGPPEEIDRACGVAQNAPEAGPSSPGGIFRVEVWIVAAGAIASVAGFYFLSPGSSSKTGQAMYERNLSGRRAYERKQGDEEEGETERERELEAGLIKDAAERKAKEAKTMRHHSS